MAKIIYAFPKLAGNTGWFDILKERVKEKSFTKKRFEAAVKNLIDTCEYPEPTIANIISFDNRIEMLTTNEVSDRAKAFGNTIWKYYTAVDIGGKLYYTPNSNVEAYGLRIWEAKRVEISPPEKEKVIWAKSPFEEIKKKFNF